MSYEEKELTLEDMLSIIKQSIKQGRGLISYRKHFELLLKLEKRLEMMIEYRKGLVKDIDIETMKLAENIDLLRKNIKESMETDESIEKTDTGGRTVFLPDLGTLSLSKEQERIVIEDAQAVMDALGESVQKVTVSLDKTKAKVAIAEKDGKVPGAKIEKYRELRVISKK